MGFNVFTFIRIMVAGVFIFSGFQKLIGPYQNFLYVVQGYAVFGAFLESVIARTAPWIEFILGLFLLFGLWLKWVLRAILIMTGMFVVIVAQAIVRGLPIVDCGCFGDLVSVPLYVMLVFDSGMLLLVDHLIVKEEKTLAFSLDAYYDKSQ